MVSLPPHEELRAALAAKPVPGIDAEGMLTLHLVHAAGEVLLARDTPVDKMGWVDEVIRDLQEKGVEFTRLDLRFPDQIVVATGR